MSGDRFDYFVVLAGMRTGSNLLEEQLNAMPGIESFGELFNPHFFGKPKVTTQFGLSMRAREADPVRVVDALKSQGDGLPGFRLFYDHDPRAIRHVLGDARAAKIVLTRRPIDSYVSLKIARKTNQWWLGDFKAARASRVAFDPVEYADFLNTLAAFQNEIAHALQVSGQTAFHISYDDLADADVLAGLGQFLGADGPPDPAKVRAKVQNPTPVIDRLTNKSMAEAALSEMSLPDVERVPHHEPERGPGLRLFRVCRNAPLVYMPIRGAGFDPVPDWLRRIDPKGEVDNGLTQRDLRRWKRAHPGHRGFTVLRHPLARAHDTFCRFVLPIGDENYADLRHALIRQYDVPLPEESPDEGWGIDQHREAFLAFLVFLKGNLGGQTSLRVDNTWATQNALLSAIGHFVVPDRLVREERLNDTLADLSREVGLPCPEVTGTFGVSRPFALADVVTDAIEDTAAETYRRDYIMYGFSSWRAAQAA